MHSGNLSQIVLPSMCFFGISCAFSNFGSYLEKLKTSLILSRRRPLSYRNQSILKNYFLFIESKLRGYLIKANNKNTKKKLLSLFIFVHVRVICWTCSKWQMCIGFFVQFCHVFPIGLCHKHIRLLGLFSKIFRVFTVDHNVQLELYRPEKQKNFYEKYFLWKFHLAQIFSLRMPQ